MHWAMSETKATSRALAQLLVLLVLALGVPALFCHWQDKPVVGLNHQNTDFSVQREELALRRAKADWVLVGNSMVNTRIDNDRLSEISGLSAHKLAKGGTQSAVWFLFLKNILAKSKQQPKWVTVFFRETDLTWADYRIDDVNEDIIAMLRGPKQAEWKQVITARQLRTAGAKGLVHETLTNLLPAQYLRPLSRRDLQVKSFRLTRIGTEMNSTQRRAEMNERFSLSHLRHDLGSDGAPNEMQSDMTSAEEINDPGIYVDGPMVFDPSPDASFLPHMVALAKQMGWKLHFHRIKKRPSGGVNKQDQPLIAAYMQNLKTWLEQNGCVFTSEMEDPALTLDMYADGDHIDDDPAIQQRYHENFWQRVKPFIRPDSSP